MVLRPGRPEAAHRGSQDRHRLAGERLVGRARCPVDRILEDAGHRVVVLRGGDQQRVGGGDALAEVADGGGQAGGLDVAVVERNAAQVEGFQSHVGRRQLDGRLQGGPVVGRLAETAGETQHADGRGHFRSS